MPLETERATYLRHRDALLASDEGRWVLIHGHQVAGCFDSFAQALTAGYEAFGMAPFMVHQIRHIERRYSVLTLRRTQCRST